MANFKPQYRATVFKPKSQQADPSNEIEVLVPVAGASHADPLQVATADVLGFKPYLGIVAGRKGRVDFKTKNTDKGSLTLAIIDGRVDETSTNAERWLTAFMGDEGGKSALLKCLVRVEESLDDGVNWSPYFTGRIEDVKQKSKIEWTIPLKDLSEDLDQRIFLGDVEPPTEDLDTPGEVPYAKRHPLIPYGLREEWGGFPAVTPRGIDGNISEGTAGFVGRIRSTPGDDSRRYSLLTDEVRNLASARKYDFTGGSIQIAYLYETNAIRVALYAAAGDFIGWYWLRALEVHRNEEDHWAIDNVFVDDAPEFGGPAFPVDGDACRWELFRHGSLTPGSAVLIDDVHPVQFMKDLFLGYFGIRNEDGTPRYGVPIDEDSFDDLIADNTFPIWRGFVDEDSNLRTFVQEKICRPCQVAYALDASGQVRVIDMRRPTEAIVFPEITDSELVAEPGAALGNWAAGDAITHVKASRVKYRRIDVFEEVYKKDAEFGEYPDVPVGGLEVIEEEAQFFALGDTRTIDFGRKTFEIDAGGLSMPVLTISDAIDIIRGRWRVLDRVVDDLFAMFSHGAGYFTLRCRRTGQAEATAVGDRRRVTCSALADPITNLRGGTRLAVCVERSEDGPVVTLGFVDLGATDIADPPTVDPPTAPAEPLCRSYFNVPITLNADAESVRVEIAIVDIGDPQPGASAAEWEFYSTVTGSTGLPGLVIGPLPSGRRVYVRARTMPLANSGLKLPSAWVSPDPAFMDTCLVAGPIACAIVVENGVRRLTWTNTSDDLSILILIDGVVVTTLPAGSTSYPLNNVGAAGSVEVAYVDGQGGRSSSCAVEYTTSPTVQAPRPAGLDVLQPSSILVGLFPANDPAYPGVYFRWKIERAEDDGTGTAPNLATVETIADDLDLGPGVRTYPDPQPFGAGRLWYRAYHVLTGFLDSDPTPWDSGVPTPGSPPDPSPVLPTIEEVVTETADLGTVELLITDPQGRLISVEWKERDNGNPETAYTVDAGEPWIETVPITAGQTSTITYRVTAYDADGVPRVIATRTVTFGGGANNEPSFVTAVSEASLPNHRVATAGTGILVVDDPVAKTLTISRNTDAPPEEGGAIETTIEIVLWASNLTKAWSTWPLEPAQITQVPVVQTHFPLTFYKFARIVAVVESTTLPTGAAVAVQYETADPDVWEFLDQAGGPYFLVDETAVLNKAEPGDYVEIDVDAKADVRLRLVAFNGDGSPATFLVAAKFVLQLTAQPEVDPPETTDPPLPPDPGSCTVPTLLDAFGYANVAALDAAWPED